MSRVLRRAVVGDCVRGALVCLSLLAGVAPTRADAHPDFSGTWVVEAVEVKGDTPVGGDGREGRGPGGPGGPGGRRGPGGGSGGGRRGGGGGRPGGGPPPDDAGTRRDGGPLRYRLGERLRMRQTDELLIVTHEQGDGAVMSRFAFDGSEVRSAGGGSARSTWEGVALLTTGKVPLPGGRGGEIKVREVRTLGPEGRTQMLTVTQRSPMGTQVMTVTLGRQGEN